MKNHLFFDEVDGKGAWLQVNRVRDDTELMKKSLFETLDVVIACPFASK